MEGRTLLRAVLHSRGLWLGSVQLLGPVRLVSWAHFGAQAGGSDRVLWFAGGPQLSAVPLLQLGVLSLPLREHDGGDGRTVVMAGLH